MVSRGDYPIREYGFVVSEYGTYWSLSPYNTKIVLGTTPPDTFSAEFAFSRNNYDTSMYVRAYVVNEIGTAYSVYQRFTVKDLQISSVFPEAAERGDTIRIFGQGFNPALEKNSVKIHNTPAEIVAVTEEYMVAIMPSGIEPGLGMINLPVTVKSDEQEVTFNGISAIPTMLSLQPHTGTFRTIVEIKLDNFTGSTYDYTIWFGDVSGVMNYHSGNTLTAAIPDDMNRNNFIIKIGFGSYKSRNSSEFQMQELILNSVIPARARPGNDIYIYASNLNPVYNLNWARIGSTALWVTGSGTDHLSLYIPESVSPGIYDVELFNHADTAILKNGIEILPP
jgi:hypothetical protein